MADLAYVLLTLVFFSGLAFIVVRIERSERAGAQNHAEIRGASDSPTSIDDIDPTTTPKAARK